MKISSSQIKTEIATKNIK